MSMLPWAVVVVANCNMVVLSCGRVVVAWFWSWSGSLFVSLVCFKALAHFLTLFSFPFLSVALATVATAQAVLLYK